MELGHEVIFVVKYQFFIEDKAVIAKRYEFVPSSSEAFRLPEFRPVVKEWPNTDTELFFDTVEEAIITLEMTFPEMEIYILRPDISIGQRDWISRMVYTNQAITRFDFGDLLEKYRKIS